MIRLCALVLAPAFIHAAIFRFDEILSLLLAFPAASFPDTALHPIVVGVTFLAAFASYCNVVVRGSFSLQ